MQVPKPPQERVQELQLTFGLHKWNASFSLAIHQPDPKSLLLFFSRRKRVTGRGAEGRRHWRHMGHGRHALWKGCQGGIESAKCQTDGGSSLYDWIQWQWDIVTLHWKKKIHHQWFATCLAQSTWLVRVICGDKNICQHRTLSQYLIFTAYTGWHISAW